MKHPANWIPPIVATLCIVAFMFHLELKHLRQENTALKSEVSQLSVDREALIGIINKTNKELQGMIEQIKGKHKPVIEADNGDYITLRKVSEPPR